MTDETRVFRVKLEMSQNERSRKYVHSDMLFTPRIVFAHVDVFVFFCDRLSIQAK